MCNLQGALDLLQEVEQRAEAPPAPPAPPAPAAFRRWLPRMTPATSSKEIYSCSVNKLNTPSDRCFQMFSVPTDVLVLVLVLFRPRLPSAACRHRLAVCHPTCLPLSRTTSCLQPGPCPPNPTPTECLHCRRGWVHIH